MHRLNTADLYLARLAARPPYRWTIYIVFFLTATASLYLRVSQGRSDQVLPIGGWLGGALTLYGFGMAAAAREPRSRVVYGCFGLLTAAAFSRGWVGEWTRLAGGIEVAAALTLLVAFMSLSRDEGFCRKGAVLESSASQHHGAQEDSDE